MKKKKTKTKNISITVTSSDGLSGNKAIHVCSLNALTLSVIQSLTIDEIRCNLGGKEALKNNSGQCGRQCEERRRDRKQATSKHLRLKMPLPSSAFESLIAILKKQTKKHG